MNNRRGQKGRALRLPPFVHVRYDARDRHLPREERRIVGYRARVTIGMRKVDGPTRDDPQLAYQDALRLRAEDELMPSQRVSLEFVHKAMIAELESVRTPGTVDFYKCQATAVWRWISKDLPVQRLTASVLQRLLIAPASESFAPRTLQHYRRYLHRLVEWCRRKRWFTGDNPTVLATWPEPRRRAPDVLTEDELAARLELLRVVPEDYALVLFFAYSGLRRAEVARLHVDDVDTKRGVFVVRGKTDDEPCPITAEIADCLQLLVERARARIDPDNPRNGDGFLVDGASEKRRVQAIDRVFRRWKERCGNDRRLHPHTMRHTLATAMIRRGIGKTTVKEMLRHASEATTELYVHLVAEDLRGAVGKLRFVRGGPEGEAKHG